MQTELVQCIKCGGDRCFLWKIPLALIHTSQWSSSASKPLAFMAYLSSPKKYLLLGFLERIAILDSLIHLVLWFFELGWAWSNEQSGPIIPLVGPVDGSFSSSFLTPTGIKVIIERKKKEEKKVMHWSLTHM